MSSIIHDPQYKAQMELAISGCAGFIRNNIDQTLDDPEDAINSLIAKWAGRMVDVQLYADASEVYNSEMVLIQFAMVGIHYIRVIVDEQEE